LADNFVGASECLEFIAVITQSGTSAPTMAVKKNTLGLPTITPSRISAGFYSSASFTASVLSNYTKFSISITSSVILIGAPNSKIDYSATISSVGGGNYVLYVLFTSVATNGDRTLVDVDCDAVLTIKYVP